MHILTGAMNMLAQIKTLNPSEPRLGDDASQAMTLIMLIVLAAGILAIALRPSKRDRAED